jgi:hypothetical protein
MRLIMEPMVDEAASGLGKKIIAKINELINSLTTHQKADAA